MGFPYFKFTFYHAILYPAGVVVNQPVNWKECAISLVRDPNYHSIVEFFKGDFLWYGSARNVMLEVLALDGPDGKLGIKIELTETIIAVWDQVFLGVFDLSLKEDLSKKGTFYKMKCPIIQDDFWVQFINHADNKVDVQSTTSLNGTAITPANKITLPLPSQKIRGNSHFELLQPVLIGTLYDYTFSDASPQIDLAPGHYAQVDFNGEIQNEVKHKFSLPIAPSGTIIPVNIFTAEFAGSYTFDIKITLMRAFELSIPTNVPPNDPSPLLGKTENSGGTRLIRAYIQKNNEAPVEFTITDTDVFIFTKISGFTEYDYNATLDLEDGDTIRIYLQKVGSGNFVYQNNGAFRTIDQLYILGRDMTVIQLSGGGFPGWTDGGDKIDMESFQDNYATTSYFKITADTLFEDTQTDAFLIGDVAKNIINQISNADGTFISDYFTNHCRRLNATMKGLHVRGWSFADKKLFTSWKDWWENFNPLLCLGVGYTEVAGVPKIKVEDRSHFYNTDISVNFDTVERTKKFDLNKFIKALKIGYKDWSAESGSGIDDIQTVHDYNSKLERIGIKLEIISNVVGAALAIEQTRRNQKEKTKDWRFDEKDMVIAVKEDEEAPDGYSPEFMERFNSVSNLLNPDFRYNHIHSVARIFRRHQAFLEGFLKAGDKWKFGGAEGNYDAESDLKNTDCEYNGSEPLAEDQDIDFIGDNYFTPDIEEVEIPMSWEEYKSIRAAREKAIGIEGEPYFIIDGDGYKIMERKATFVVLKAVV